MAGSRLRYKLLKMTCPSLRSDAFGVGFVWILNVFPGMISGFGRSARWTERNVEAIVDG